MIDGLKLTLSGEALRSLLESRIEHHGKCADRWARETARTPEDETEDAPLLPEHMCENEAERHAWRTDVLEFIRDHLEPGETYHLSAADLEFAELLPPRPEWMEQDTYEEQHRVGFALERVAKAIEGLACARPMHFEWSHPLESSDAAPAPGTVEETEEFRAARVCDSPEIVTVSGRNCHNEI